MHNAIAHHLPTDTQTVPKQRSLLPGQLPPSLYTEHDVTWYGIALWPAWVSCPGCAPPSFLCTLSLAKHGKLKRSLT